ncbi:MAG: sodium:phosphate symporter [Acidimicrobiia bacterium]|nr:MAG: sodium:phosphate symporter [Acidimicrobiia bacterium]
MESAELPQSPSPIVRGPKRTIPPLVRAVAVIALLYLFLVGVKLLESGVESLGSGTAGGLFDGITNPLAALFVGILATVLVQSSSVTTSTIVGLVAAGQLPLETAVPMIMGANIGTTITNTIVSLAHARKSEEFRLAFSAATMHDFFNLIAVAILLPLEIATGFLQKTATWFAELLPSGADATFNSPIKGAVKWGVGLIKPVIETITSSSTTFGVAFILLGIAIIFITLMLITKNMKVLIAARIETSINVALAKSGMVGMMVGILVTVAVQSSSITTSILVPLVASGILLVRNAYPITLGANIGTTVTALLAALATGVVGGMTIALVHLLFNIVGILLLYPIPKIRYLPVTIAEKLATLAVARKWLAVAYVGIVFIAIPIVGILILD